MPEQLLTGWGRTCPARSDVVTEVPRPAGPRGLLARGGGRSYGDAAQNSGGTVVRLPSQVRLDPVSGVVRASGGTSLHTLLQVGLPQGWSLPVVPGTRHATVGGAVAADVHGKNHHVAGTISRHLLKLELEDGTGAVRTLHPGDDGFWATVGGMGLTGVVRSATLQLVPVDSAFLQVHDERCADLDAVLAGLQDAQTSPYAVAWVDALPRRVGWGRGIVSRAWFAAASEVSGDPFALAPGRQLSAPPVPVSLVTRASVRAFNAAWFRRPAGESQVPAAAFFHPLDGLGGWNRLYGPRGFVQYQFVVPPERTDALTGAMQVLAGHAPFLGVLKRFGAAGPAPLSFPRPGWSLALDLPAGTDGLAAVLDRADEVVAAAGGAVYLAKDARLRPDLLQAMYPRLTEWRAEQERTDPYGSFRSDLDRRLGLVDRKVRVDA